MLANQKLLVETMQACHRNSDSILALVSKVCSKMSLADVASECEQVREVLKDTNTMFATLHDASTADLSQVLGDVKKYASEVVVQDTGCSLGIHLTCTETCADAFLCSCQESREMQSTVTQKSDALVQDVNERFKKLEARVLSELGGEEKGSQAKGDSQLLKKMTNRMSDFESQVSAQIQQLTQDRLDLTRA